MGDGVRGGCDCGFDVVSLNGEECTDDDPNGVRE